MTDEELARQKAEEIEKNQTLGVYDNDEDLARDSAFNDGIVEGYEEGFLAGLKAGRPQWHDLRKDPKDLPEAHCKNWVIAVYDGGILWCRARREKCIDGVYWVNSYHHIIGNVVMWAKIEIPTFDKE